MTAVTAPKSVLRVRDFRLFWLGEAISTLGDQFAMIALPWLALILTGDAFALGAGLEPTVSEDEPTAETVPTTNADAGATAGAAVAS